MIARENLIQIGEAINARLIKYWELQGHIMPGSQFVEQMEIRIDEERMVLESYSVHYARFVNTGVPAANIPFTPGSGRRHSKYIEGLYKYVTRRMGLTDREALSVAFAIAHKHKAEGMPTDGSRQHSQTGERTHFLDNAFEEIEDEGVIESIIDEMVLDEVDKNITKHI